MDWEPTVFPKVVADKARLWEACENAAIRAKKRETMPTMTPVLDQYGIRKGYAICPHPNEKDVYLYTDDLSRSHQAVPSPSWALRLQAPVDYSWVGRVVVVEVFATDSSADKFRVFKDTAVGICTDIIPHKNACVTKMNHFT